MWRAVAIGASLLWVATLAGWWLSAPTPDAPEPVASTDDPRQIVWVSADQQAMVKAVMQENLGTVHAILKAEGENDLARVATLAQSASDSPGVGRRDPSLRERLPKGWRGHGRTVHREYAALAEVLNSGGGKELIAPALSRVTAACLACHASYRLVVGEVPVDP
jgi:cytochrome c556